MAIVDGFTFFNEFDILDLRIKELYPVVDYFILVESDLTFRGDPKPYYFEENIDRFWPYRKKIVHVKVEGDPNAKSPWDREYAQRRAITFGFEFAASDDILIFGDVDEIPRREIVETLDPQPIVTIRQDMYVYKLNLFAQQWASLKAVRKYAIDDLQKIRMTPPTAIVENGGWHFSSLGTPEEISHKFKSFSHSEIDVPEYTDPVNIARRIENRLDPIDRSALTKVEIDQTWPREVLRCPEYWSKYIC